MSSAVIEGGDLGLDADFGLRVARFAEAEGVDERLEVFGRGAAAAADDVDAVLGDEAHQPLAKSAGFSGK